MGDEECELILDYSYIGFINENKKKILFKPPKNGPHNDIILRLPSSIQVTKQNQNQVLVATKTEEENNTYSLSFLPNSDINVWSQVSDIITPISDTYNKVKVKNIEAQSFNCSSDKRLKKNIETIKKPLDKLRKINGYTYLLKSNNKLNSGVLAQEIEKVIPFAVSISNDNMKSVNYNFLIPYIIESIKINDKDIKKNNKILLKSINRLYYVIILQFFLFFIYVLGNSYFKKF